MPGGGPIDMSEIKHNALGVMRPSMSGSPSAGHAARLSDRSGVTAVLSQFASVLIVDDDDALRRALSRFFRSVSIGVTEAKSVREALVHLEREPELVITDVRLPDGSGRLVVAAASQRRPVPVIVAMSGLASAREAFALAQAGARVYLTKPFVESELADSIAEFCREAHPRAGGIEADLSDSLISFAQRYSVPEREMELVRLATAGVPRGRCPDMLGISENTCKTLTRRLLQRCGARSLAQIPRLVLIGEDQQHNA